MHFSFPTLLRYPTDQISKTCFGQEWIEFERADRDWEANLDRRMIREPAGKAESLAGEIPPASFLEAQRNHEWLKVQKAELDLKVRRGELLEREEVERRWGALLTTFRNRMLLLPDKVAPRAAVLDSVLECRALLEREVKEALSALSEYEPNAA